LIDSRPHEYRPSSDAVWLPTPQALKRFFVSAHSPMRNALAPAEPGSTETPNSLISLELGREGCLHVHSLAEEVDRETKTRGAWIRVRSYILT